MKTTTLKMTALISCRSGGDWATIQKQIDRIGKPVLAILLTLRIMITL